MLLTGAAVAQPYPSKPVRLVVPFPPGGPADSVARVLAQKLGDVLGQPVVVDNRAGATGTIGAGIVAKSPPDGYTLLLGTSNELAMSPGLYEKLPYDPTRDFAPLSNVINFPNILVVNPHLPADTVSELVALARMNTDIGAVANSQDMKDRMSAQAAEVATTSPAEFAAMIRNDYAKWSRVIKDAGLRAE